MESRGQIVKAMAVIQRPRDGALLVSEETNPAGELFHRPLGGHVEFGEYARDTVHREFQEEIGQALTGVRLAGVLENIFPWGGATQHEIVFVFTAAFADEAAYEIREQSIADDQKGGRVIWRAPGEARLPLYPVGVAQCRLVWRDRRLERGRGGPPGVPRRVTAGVWVCSRPGCRTGKRPVPRPAGAVGLGTVRRSGAGRR